MITDVSYTTSLSSFKNVGQLLYDLGLSADSVRVIDSLKSSKAPEEKIKNSIVDLENLILDLESIQGIIFEDFNQWSYCSSAEIVTSPVIPLVYFYDIHPKIGYSNLYDSVSEVILACKSIIKAISENESYLKYIKFIIVNGSGHLYDRVNSTMNGIVDCEIERVKDTGTYITILLIFGFCVLAALSLVVIGFIFLVSKKYDKFWNFIINNSQPALAKLKSSAVDRLILIHGIDYNSESNTEISGSRIKRKVRTSVYLQYSYRLMIFFVIGAFYYILISIYLYPQCEVLMINRPKLLSNFNMRRSNLRWLSMFSRETYNHYLQKKIPQYFKFANAWTSVYKASDILKLKNKELRESDLKNLMSQELKERIYVKVDSNHTILNHGSETAINIAIDDNQSHGLYELLTGDKILSLFLDVVAIQNEISQEFQLADRDSKNLISGKLDSIINTTIAYSIALLILYFCYYLPYLNRRIKYLSRFLILTEILQMDQD
ncbi:unnamed protein product [Blepharisma stoltei]|uniref:Uncharacterized protein n=1 Tax=Blepharisma stoltei TaxID=1481888 RepID=A0AAU9ISP7_9CILI|nr:unnamed protein product [Blepharisma stoltei]